MLVVLWPNISETIFISAPASYALLVNVCLVTCGVNESSSTDPSGALLLYFFTMFRITLFMLPSLIVVLILVVKTKSEHSPSILPRSLITGSVTFEPDLFNDSSSHI